MHTSTWRPAARGLVAVSVLSLIALAFAHAPLVRNWVRAWAEARVSAAIGARVTVTDLRYNLFTLSATLRGVSATATDGTPLLEVERVLVNAPLGVVFGARHLQEVELLRPRLHLAGLRAWLDARRPSGPAPADRPFTLGRVRVEHFDLVGDSETSGVNVDLRDVSLASTDGGNVLSAPIVGGTGAIEAGGRRLDLTRIEGVVRYDGESVSVDPLHVLSAEGELTATGSLGLLTPTPRWDVTLTATADLARALQRFPGAPAVEGQLQLQGTITGPRDAPHVRMTARSDRLTVSGVLLTDLEAEASLAEAGLDISRATVQGLGGRLTSQFLLGPGGTVDRGRLTWDGVDLAGLLTVFGRPMAIGAAASGAATFNGAVDDPASWQASVEGRLAPAPRRGLPAAARVTATLTGGRWNVRVVDAAAGDLEFAGHATGAWRPPSSTFRDSMLAGTIDVSTPDLGRVLAQVRSLGASIPDGVAQRVEGPLQARLELGGTLVRPDVRAVLSATDLRVQDLGQVNVTGTLALIDGHLLSFEGLEARPAEGQVRVEGTVDLRSRTLALDLEATRLSLPAIAPLVLPARWAPAAGRLTLKGRLTGSPARPQADLTLAAGGIRWYGQSVDRLAARLRTSGALVLIDDLELSSGAGTLTLRGRVDPAAETYDITAVSSQYPVDPIVAPGPPGSARTIDVSGQVTLEAAGAGTFDRPGGRATFTLTAPRFERWQPGEVTGSATIDEADRARVLVEVPRLGVSLAATVALASPFAYEASATGQRVEASSWLEAAGAPPSLRDDLHGTLTFTAGAQGSLADPGDTRLAVELGAFSGTVFGLPVTLTAPATVHASATEVGTTGLALRSRSTTLGVVGTLSRASEGQIVVEARGTLDDLTPLVTRLTGRAALAAGEFSGRLAASGPLDGPRFEGGLTLTGGRVQLDGWPAITSLDLQGRVGDGVILLDGSRAHLDGGLVEVSGQLPLRLIEALPAAGHRATPTTGDAELRLSATAFPISRLMGAPAAGDVLALVDARAELAAPRLAIEAVTGRVWVDRGTLSLSDLRLQQDTPAEFMLAGGRASFEAWRWTGPRTDLVAAGTLDYGHGPLAYAVDVKGPVDLAMLGLFLPGRTAGRLQVDLRAARVDGTTRATGNLVVTDGAWLDRDLQVAMSGVGGTVRLLGNRLIVDGVTGRLNGGDIALTGAMALAADTGVSSGAISITARRVTIEFPERLFNEVDADLQLVAPGPRNRPFGLTGQAEVTPGLLRASLRELALLAAPAAPPLPTPEVERRQRLLSTVALEVAVRTRDDLIADSNELKGQLGAALTITGSLAEPGLLGRAEIRPEGELFLAGRLYEIRGGQIDFVDPARIAPRINLLGETRVSDYEIQLQLTGPVDRLDLRLRSTPPLSQGDLASLLTTGQTLKERREQSEQAASEAAGAQLLSAVSSEYLGAIGRLFGVDTVRIENSTRDLSAVDLDPVARLSVTKELGSMLSVVFSQSLEQSDDIGWILSFRPGWRGLEAKSIFTGGRGEAYEVRQELLFGGSDRTRPGRRRSGGRPSAPRVSEVRITGVPAQEAAELTRRLSLKAGGRFDVYRWQRDRGRIERFYRDRHRLRTTVAATREPSADGSTIALGFAVDRGQVVDLRVEGYRFGAQVLEALREAAADSPIAEFVGEAVTDVARLALAADGHVVAKVEASFEPVTADRRELVVRVDPGPRAGSREYRFSGNRTFQSARLAALLEEARVGDLPWVRPDAAEAPLAFYYASAGFLNVRVSAGEPRIDGQGAILPIAIEEGRQFRVSALDVTGIQQVAQADVLAALALPPGSVFTADESRAATQRVLALYARQGHAEASVRLDTDFDRDRSQVRLRLQVEEGVRRELVEVTTAGDVRTARRLIDRALTLETGGPVDGEQVDAAQRRLYDLGVFRSVEPRFEPVGPPIPDVGGGVTQPVRLVFDLEEYARYRLRYGFQVSTVEATPSDVRRGAAKPGVTLDVRRNNLFGSGIDAGAGAFFSQARSRLRALAQAATLGGRRVQTTATLTRDWSRKVGSEVDLEQLTTTLAAEQRWKPTRRSEFAYAYNLEYNEADFLLKGRGLDPFGLSLSARVASLSSVIVHDTRDNLVNPTRGMFHAASVEAGTSWLGSQIDYVSYVGQHYLFVPAGRVTLASAVRFGTVAIAEPQEGSLEAILVRFTTGGGTTVRGYRQDELTPEIIPGLPRGGDVLLVLNQEARLRLTNYLALVGFVDAGNTFSTWQDFAWADLAVGVGTGLRLISPVGVIRLDVGLPRPRPAGAPLARWYFSFGHAF